MAHTCTILVLMIVSLCAFSAVAAQSPAASPKAAVAHPPKSAAHSPKSPKAPSPPSPTPPSAPSPSAPPSSISSPPSEAPGPSVNGAVSSGFAVAGSVAVSVVAAVLIM